MGLINCSNCGSEYSDKLDNCPECGCSTYDTIATFCDEPMLETIRRKYPVNPEHAVKEYVKRTGTDTRTAKKAIKEYYAHHKEHIYHKSLKEQFVEMQQIEKAEKRRKAILCCPRCNGRNIDILSVSENTHKVAYITPTINPLMHKATVVEKENISLSKLGLGIATGGTSLLFTGIKEKKHNKYLCRDCGKIWVGE
jgi:uncharacterized protein YbaR (Trm112 family)